MLAGPLPARAVTPRSYILDGTRGIVRTRRRSHIPLQSIRQAEEEPGDRAVTVVLTSCYDSNDGSC